MSKKDAKKSSSESGLMSLRNNPWVQIAAVIVTALATGSGTYLAATPSQPAKPTAFECSPTKVIVPLDIYLNGKRIKPE